MSLHQVWAVPVLTFVFSLAAFLLSYFIALSQNHVNAFWPYISDSGTMAPESCYFAQLLNLSALFLAISVYLRHRQIIEFYWHHCGQKGGWRQISTTFLWVGYTSAFGISLVANFQESNVIIVHYCGAFLAFTAGLLYLWAQTWFSYMMNPRLSSIFVAHVRLALSILATFFYGMTITFALEARKHRRTNVTMPYVWDVNDEYYLEHTVATISEWALAICFQIYILSFALELRNARCHAPKLRLQPAAGAVSDSSAISTSSSCT